MLNYWQVSGLLALRKSGCSAGNFDQLKPCRYFKSWFHCFDALVILVGFVIDVCLKGVLAEVGSLVVVLRLWRVFKIIEEFSAGASETMDKMTEVIEQLQLENKELKKELVGFKWPGNHPQEQS